VFVHDIMWKRLTAADCQAVGTDACDRHRKDTHNLAIHAPDCVESFHSFA
jgi:hypothetical protein